MILPLRCDLNRVALLQCPASAATISQDDVDTVKENNFLCLPADRKKPAILVLREFKTANSAGIWRRTLPINLTQEVWTSLQAESPRRWLFTTKSGSHSKELQQMVLFCAGKAVWQTANPDVVETWLSE